MLHDRKRLRERSDDDSTWINKAYGVCVGHSSDECPHGSTAHHDAPMRRGLRSSSMRNNGRNQDACRPGDADHGARAPIASAFALVAKAFELRIELRANENGDAREP